VVGTQSTTWECGWLEKVFRVRNENVDDLERCLKYGLGCGRYPACEIGLWMAWKGTSCTECDCVWFEKVHRVWFG
jgi:hypothetical protein